MKMSKKNKIIWGIVAAAFIFLILTFILTKVVFRPSDTETTGKADETQESETEEIVLVEAGTEESVLEETETEEAEQETTLFFAGDACFAYTFEDRYLANGITGVISEELLHEMQEADITMVNQEFAFSTGGTPAPDKQYTFRVNPKYVSAFEEMGVDLVTLANNHSLDYGTEALEDTFHTLDQAGIVYVGAGDSLERASKLQVFEVNGKKFGYLAASRVIPVGSWNVENNQPGLFCTYDETLLLAAIEQAKTQCDFLTVYVHWGVERSTTPEAYQTSMAEEYIEAGADLVIGAHTHCLQGIQFFDGKPVFYSLGNYIFNATIEKTAAVKVVVNPDGTVSYQLLAATASNGKTVLMEGVEKTNLYQYMEGLSYGVKIDEDGYVTEE
ncbi:MAG: CapA family protein [Roseburia sp.]